MTEIGELKIVIQLHWVKGEGETGKYGRKPVDTVQTGG